MSYRKEVLIPYIKSAEEREKKTTWCGKCSNPIGEPYGCYCEREKAIEDKYKNCSHPYRKMGCCDICGKDLVGE